MFNWLHKLLYRRKYQQAEIFVAHVNANCKTTDDYRERFKIAPLGQWSHAVGTFSNVMNEIWEFHADNTGKIISTGPFGGASGETLFDWKPVADFTIACKVTKWDYEDDEDFVADEDDEPEIWQTVRYDFTMVPTDYGELVAMVEIARDGSLGSGFWQSVEPLSNDDKW